MIDIQNQNLTRVEEIFLDIVQIDSPTGNEQKMSEYCVQFLQKVGCKAEIDEFGNVFCQVEGKMNLEPYLLTAHLDTVEPGRGVVPIVTEESISSDGNTILGADNKTAVASILALTERIQGKKKHHNHPLEIVFTVSEEVGNMGARSFDCSKLRAKRGFASDATNREFGDLIIASPFYNRIEIELFGKGAHASMPTLGVNPLPLLGKILDQVQFGEMKDGSLVNFGLITAGSATNSVPENVKILGEIRSHTENSLEVQTNQIVDKVKNITKNTSVTQIIKIIRENAGFLFLEDEEFIKNTRKIIENVKGDRINLIKSWGCYDANIFAERGIQILNFADGSFGAHTTHEGVGRKNLNNLGQLLFELVSS